MSRVHKFTLDIADGVQSVLIPEGAQILTVKLQQGRPQIWALVDVSRPKVIRNFIMVPTGPEVDLGREPLYIGTIMTSNELLVFHFFEVA